MTEQYIEELIQKYADGQATHEEIEQLRTWYRLQEIEEVRWNDSAINEKEQLRDRMLLRLKNNLHTKPSRIVHLNWFKAAAIFIVIIGAAFLVYQNNTAFESYITVTNNSGGIKQIVLPDSSRVWMNAATTIKHKKYFQNNREVVLNGEAYFEVTHDSQNPFSVEAGGLTTTVLGTRFNIKAYPEGKQATISLLSGKVSVSEYENHLAVLEPATQLAYNRRDKKADIISVDSSEIIAWKNGLLQFHGETFGEIKDVLERWYGVNISFSDAGMSHCRYYMSFKNTISLEDILNTISEIAQIKYTINNGKILITGKPCQ